MSSPPSSSSRYRVFLSDRACIPSLFGSSLSPAAVRIDTASGRIAAIDTDVAVLHAYRTGPPSPDTEVVDAGSDVLMSGIVDSHVHANEPGRTDWEGLQTATKAAAAGGVTTIVDMPLNSIPPTTTLEGLKAKESAAIGKLTVDLGLWGGIIPSNLNDLKDLAAGGVCGFKCFMIESGVDEFPCVSPAQLKAAMEEVVRSCPTLPVLCHAEACAAHEHPNVEGEACDYKTYLHSRPPTFETSAIGTALQLAEETGARTHVVHLSAAEGVPLFKAAQDKGLKQVSVETCPHYLTLDADSIPNGATAFKCAPPIRGRDNQRALWQALRDGVINMIVSDHSPCEPSLKLLEDGDFGKAWGGISSLQLGLPLIFSELRAQAIEAGQSEEQFLGTIIRDLNQWMSRAPAEFVNFSHRKGALAVGMDGDLAIFSPERTVLVEQSMIEHKHKLTPYLGRTLYGAVTRTVLRGHIVYQKEEGQAPVFLPPVGQRVKPASHPEEKERLDK